MTGYTQNRTDTGAGTQSVPAECAPHCVAAPDTADTVGNVAGNMLPRRTLWQSAQVYLQPETLRMVLLGFAAGLPLMLVVSGIGYWLAEAGINKKNIGYLSLVALAYSFKWAWSPLVDSLKIPVLTKLLGRRRSWLLLAQVGVIAGVVGMAYSNPQTSLNTLVWCAVVVAFCGATQDIALDAFRIESAEDDAQSALAACYLAGYRLAMFWVGAGLLKIVARAQSTPEGTYDYSAWQTGYLIMAVSMFVGLFTVLYSREPVHAVPDTQADSASAGQRLARWLTTAVVLPFVDFFKRYGWHALLILALISVYRISDIVMGAMTGPLYVELGYSKDAVANVTKIFGVIMTLVGAGLGGILSMRLGVLFTLALGALLSAGSNLAFSWLSVVPLDHVVPLWTGKVQLWLSNIAGTDAQLKLAGVIAIDNLSQGIATAAFIAYLSSLTNVRFSATQYALFSSIMTLIPKTLGGFSGEIINRITEAVSTGAWQWLPSLSLKMAPAEQWGFSLFFAGTALIGLPVLLLVAIVAFIPNLRGSKPNPIDSTEQTGQ